MIGSHFNATPPWTSALPGCKNCRSWWSTNSCMMDAVDVAYRRRANLDVLDNSTFFSSSPKIRRLLFQNPSQNFPTISYMKAGPVSRTQKKTGIFQHRCISHEAWIFIWKTRPMQYNSLLPLGGEVSFAPNSGIFPPNFGTFWEIQSAKEMTTVYPSVHKQSSPPNKEWIKTPKKTCPALCNIHPRLENSHSIGNISSNGGFSVVNELIPVNWWIPSKAPKRFWSFIVHLYLQTPNHLQKEYLVKTILDFLRFHLRGSGSCIFLVSC